MLRWFGVATTSAASIFAGPSLHAKTSDLTKGTKKPGTGQYGSGWASLYGETENPPEIASRVYPWRSNIVTTTFWIGEKPTKNNPVPNHKSCWDVKWAENYGGYDSPKRKDRLNTYIPKGFIPRQNPFYVALPYNDMTMKGHKSEASQVIPWFNEVFENPHKSVCKGRWIAIRRGNRIAYAQWEDGGPFRTDHWQYVFGNERPKPNLNKGAGLDVSPAVRDYLGMEDTDVTDWKFVEFKDVPVGPWSTFGDNNTFVINRRAAAEQEQLAALKNPPIPFPTDETR